MPSPSRRPNDLCTVGKAVAAHRKALRTSTGRWLSRELTTDGDLALRDAKQRSGPLTGVMVTRSARVEPYRP